MADPSHAPLCGLTSWGEPEKCEVVTSAGDGRRTGSRRREIFKAYVPNPGGRLFMARIVKTFGTNGTTHT